MPVSERAKQFMPFAAVGGLNEALTKKEREACAREKQELSADKMEEINGVLLALKPGMTVAVRLFQNGEVRPVTAKVRTVDPIFHRIKTEQGEIVFEEITDIVIL